MMYTHITASDLDLKQSKSYLDTLIVNKKPGEMTNSPRHQDNTMGSSADF
jgi:hypothetical protein